MKKALFLIILFFANVIESKSLLKSGFYKSIGVGSGYYNYNEFKSWQNDAFIMRIDSILFNVNGELGLITHNVKIESSLDANVALGLYTGGNFYESDNKTRVYSIFFNSYYHFNLTLGFDILGAFGVQNASLFLQSGFSYFLSRTDSTPLERLQGYLSIPFSLESQVKINDKWSIDSMFSYNLFLLGHHLSYGNAYGLSGDLNVLQRQGYGLKAYLGYTHKNKADSINSLRLVYEFWSIGDSPAARVNSVISPTTNGIYEPKNTSHIVTIQYIFGF
ncbi:hypothetical protein DCO58_09865 [Helicobacter saguini]|uniref:Outer membrane protein n=1 Tax=Helicobacter saguini TaxID=1548018 RepID=A0A347VPF5_9HELI|nr:hypothetical protein [Helicobacter saguini]MWV61385.1 hypothetical protein [Helicobacter saguini]MWV67947.1 hypothetical protein [Helicobacter saguini]MWV70586.1 hypothetical protein [Helicobacter saguini]MWV72490.1 hypothetical protein [Helicobacter saguini]TLD94763.1 hypothetical protein LS64_004440 [Helicobacter saguini]